MTVRYYSSVAPETTLSGGITNAATVITVGSVVGFPALTPYTLALDYEGATEELVQVDNAAGTTLTVVRAIDGTSAASHNAGARVRHVSSARDFMDSRNHENADDGIHGLAPGDVIVGEDAVQTLTNKTLLSPGIVGGLITNASWGGSFTGGANDTLRSTNVNDVTLTSTLHALQIGSTAGVNLRMDNNEIQTVNNGVKSSYTINADGGNVNMFTSLPADSTTDSFVINGGTQATFFTGSRPAGTSTTFLSRINGDANGRLLLRADGQVRFSDGTAASDAAVYRSNVGVVQVENNLTMTGTVTSGGVTATGSSTVNNLTVTGTFTPPATTATDASVFTIAAGWTLNGAQAYKVGGMTTIAIQVTRTGAVLTGFPGTGNISPDSQIGTVVAGFRPASPIATGTGSFYTAFGNGVTQGQCRYNTDHTIDLVTWMPSENIDSGTGVNRFIMTFPSA